MQVGRFKVVEELGSGQFGTVYLAFSNSQPYALKSIRFHEEELINLHREILTMSSIFSPFVVQLYEDIWTEDSLFLAMEYCHGGSLEEFIRENRVTAGTACRWLWEVARALADIHSHGIVHRDLKPENILLTEKHENAHIKVTDFGTARSLDYSGRLSVTGTPLYMAPEMLSGESYSEKVDVWSFGVVANRLLEGPLFKSVGNLLDLSEEYKRTQSFDESCGLHPAAVALLKATLSEDPQQRPSFQDLLTHPYFQPLYQPAVEVYVQREADWIWELAEFFQQREDWKTARLLFQIYQREAMKYMNPAYWRGSWDGNAISPAPQDGISLLVRSAERLSQEFWEAGALRIDLLRKALQLLQVAAAEAPLRQGEWAGLQHWILTKMSGFGYAQ